LEVQTGKIDQRALGKVPALLLLDCIIMGRDRNHVDF